MFLRAAFYVSTVLILGVASHGSAQTAPAQSAAQEDCAPPPNFSERFPKLTEKKALGKVSRRTLRQLPGLFKANNLVTGTEVDSNDLYAQTFMGGTGYARNHTYAAIVQMIGGERTYSIRISDTEYTEGSQPYFSNDLTELHIEHDGKVIVVPRTQAWEEGFCSTRPDRLPKCYNTAIGSFTIERDLFEALAARDPAKTFTVAARKRDGTMTACPYYFSPMSFKAPMLKIDEAFAAAVAKRAKQKG